MSPATAAVLPGETVRLEAIVTGTNDTRVLWEVRSGGGTVDSAGLFTAPLQEGTSELRATSVKDPEAFAHARVRVRIPPPPLSIALLPATLKLQARSTTRFEVQVSNGTGSEQFEWLVVEGDGGGTILETETDKAIIYQAPYAPGTFHLSVRVRGNRDVSALATVTVTSEALRATVSGTVHYTGQKAGRVYVLFAWGHGSGDSLIPQVSTSLDAPGPYSLSPIQGSSAPAYVLAFMDTQGTGRLNLATDPMALVPLRVTGEDQVLDVTLADPSRSHALRDVSGSPQAVGLQDRLFVAFGGSRSPLGPHGELADAYRIYWNHEGEPGPGNFLGSMTVSAAHSLLEHGHLVVIPRLAPGRYYVGVAPLLGSVEGRVTHSLSAGNVGLAPGAGATLSGQVQLEAPSPSGSVYVAAWNGPNILITRVPATSSSVSWSIPGLLDGDYQVWAWLDANDDGFLERATPRLDERPLVAVRGTSPVSAPTLSFVPVPTRVRATSLQQHHHLEPGWFQQGGTFYDFSFVPGGKQPAAVRMVGGQVLPVPYDVPGSFAAPLFGAVVGLAQVPFRLEWVAADLAPRIPPGTRFTGEVRYTDGSTESLAVDTPPVLPMVTLLAPVLKARSSSTPTFYWLPPANLPPSLTQRLMVFKDRPSGQLLWNRVVPLSQSQILYNDDGKAGALQPGSTYFWVVELSDGQGNFAKASDLFLVQ
ncbi:Ig-like domain-containing protein [Hyalangium gracile]|uniref:Ig-like domain-containing protein n=1 Tax=Hyalangium gracile TaxID=394092 RepID=UPI001CCE0177|nr:hypothetical protein [Hyalangium gracile]